MVAMTPKRIVFLVLGLLFATFIIQNSEVAQVRFLFWSAQASRALILLGAFFLGDNRDFLLRHCLCKPLTYQSGSAGVAHKES
jgi:uncharacterized integral membrane protein